MSADAYLSHIVSRIQSDVEFLVSQGAMSHNDARLVKDRLPAHGLALSTAPVMPTPSVSASSSPSLMSMPIVPAPIRRSNPPPPPPAATQNQARALWSYNENRQESGDLSFNEGETIEIIEEANEDWWKGRNPRGEVGLFPANYVEKIAAPGPPARMVAPIPAAKPIQPSYGYAPPPPQSGYAPVQFHAPPPPAPGPVSQAPPPPQAPPKKHKFGKLGNTLANSAAGGVGFGAGAAVGSGIINAIF
ncbi:hypothetical protein M422DRAFT_43481 [Sphaerobolus stellatus SS14]|nr:hypothetical protein M422DRAFT_43481 [Sphaerobolus stellatus SS14]